MIEKLLNKSKEQAKEYGHEYVTIEHIALVLLEEKEILEVCKQLEIDVDKLRQDLIDYLDDNEYNNLKHVSGSTGDPKKTLAVERVFQRAFAQSIFNGREHVTSIDLLVSVSEELAVIPPMSDNTSVVDLLSNPLAVNLAYSSSATLELSILTAFVLEIPKVNEA